MKKIFSLFTLLFLTASMKAQSPESLVPLEATSVFTLNNINLFQRISLDKLILYDFMEEVQQELFDGSTTGKTFRDTGIDFDQKLSIFSGSGENYEIAGFTFGIIDKNALFSVFDDYTPVQTTMPGVAVYESYFNRIVLKGNSGILFRISPSMSQVDMMTDSIWYARGNDYPWYSPDLENSMEGSNWFDQSSELSNEMESIENTSNPEIPEEFPVADDNPAVKNYYELRDSVELILHEKFLTSFSENLFVKGNNLIQQTPDFVELLTHVSEGTFYSDLYHVNANRNMNPFNLLYPQLYTDVEALYKGSVLLGDLVLKDNEVELLLKVKYNDQLGSIYQSLADARFDKNVLNYIHNDHTAFFTYNVNLAQAYEQAVKTITPILDASEDRRVQYDLLLIELINEYIDKDALFETYKGSMFGTYQGIQKVPTKKIIFEYDEETFEYIEKVVSAEEDMPLFTLGFSTKRTTMGETILKRLSRIDPHIHKKDHYWVVEQVVLESLPLYIMVVDGLFIFTNDEKLVTQYPDGYGKSKLAKNSVKKAQKSGALYLSADLEKTISDLPRGLFSDYENTVLDVLRGKKGSVELTSSATTNHETSFQLNYSFDGNESDKGSYVLDLINCLYVISK